MFGRIAFQNIDYHKHIRLALVDHYSKTFDSFIDDYRDQYLVVMPSLQEALLNVEINGLIEERASKQTKIISDTIGNLRNRANESVRKLDPKPSNPVRVSNNMMYSALIRKVDTIACYETQWAAETARFMEIVYLTGLDGITIKAAPKTMKRWDAVGDDKMRRWHADADSQVQALEEPFIVNGEYLMRPGDTSLGATASNIINCRCSVSYDTNVKRLTTAMGDTVQGLSPTGDHAAAVDKLASRIDEAIGMAPSDAISKELNDIKAKLYELAGSDGVIANTKEYDKLAKRVQVIRKQLKDSGIAKPVKVIKAPVKATAKPKMIDLGDGLFVPDDASPDEILKMLQAHQKAKLAPNFIDDPIEVIAKAKAEVLEHFPNIESSGTPPDLLDIRRKLAKLNGPGTKGVSQKVNVVNDAIESDSFDRLSKRVRDVYRDMFEDGLVHPSLIKDAMHKMTISIGRFGRASASVVRNKVSLYKSMRHHVVSHELGHHVEARNPFLETRMRKWRDSRITAAKKNGEKIIKASKNEVMWEDGFHDNYVGRVYEFGATEVLSTGLEALYDPDRFHIMMRKDPDHFYLVWAALRGY